MLVPSSSSQMRRWASQYASYAPSTDVPNLVNWWRADTVTTVSGAVSSLNDKKGSVNLAQGAALKRPVYNAADSLMGGRDSITFDGIDDVLIAASPGVGAMNAITVYMVVRGFVTPASTTYFLAVGGTSVAQSVSIDARTSGASRANYANPGGTISSWQLTSAQHDASAAAPRILSFAGTLANGGSTVWEGRARLGAQGSAVTNASTGSTLANQIVAIGGSTTGTGAFTAFTFAELMICNAAHTSEQMLAVNMYLAGYYGVLS